ncbi:MAG: RNA recognition motif domain-containing protein [Phycisphaeraceae bacterium]
MRIYVGNLPTTITEQTLSAAFGVYGQVDQVELSVDRGTGRSRGFAFVTMPDEDARSAIEQLNGVEIEGRPMAVTEAKPETGGPRHGSRRGGGQW